MAPRPLRPRQVSRSAGPDHRDHTRAEGLPLESGGSHQLPQRYVSGPRQLAQKIPVVTVSIVVVVVDLSRC